MLQQLFGIVARIHDLDQIAQPGNLPVGAIALLVGPVRGKAEFVDPVHFAGAQLHLDPHGFAIDQRGMERTIPVVLRGRDIVLELAGQELPRRMQHTQSAVAVRHFLADDAEGHDVRHLFEAHMALGHLAPDRIGVLFAARYFGGYPGFRQRVVHVERDGIDLPAILAADLVQPLGDGPEGFGFQLFESEHLHLAHIFVQPDPLCQRGIDVHCLARDALALFRVLDEMQRAHVVQPVAQLHQQHADILAHGQQELAQVFRRALVLGHLLDLGQLGHAVHQPRDIGAEIRLDVVDRRQRSFHRVVEQRGGDGFLVEFQIGHQPGDFDRMAEIGIAAGPGLRAVLLHRIDIGAVEHRLIGVGVVFLDPLYEFVLAQHSVLTMWANPTAMQRKSASGPTKYVRAAR